MTSALVCVSGGVDSTAALLRSAKLFQRTRAVFVDVRESGVPSEAAEACSELGVELTVIPGQESFRELVKGPSQTMMKQGLTPNPCALCNAGVKLAMPFSLLDKNELLVTGHYAGMRNGFLCRGADRSKDQSYFLSLVPYGILARCFFPLSDSLKEDVRNQVKESGLPFIEKESQDLCFTHDAVFEPGEIVDLSGRVTGRHEGLAGYTPGQRKGIGAHAGKKYVVRLDRVLNQVVIGDENDLYSKKCRLNSINWLQRPDQESFRCLFQTRYRKTPFAAQVVLDRNRSEGEVLFDQPQKAVAPGQVGALYEGDSVTGGGIISIEERWKQIDRQDC
ncbi:hypothetical protein CSA37_03770 [Candidatus Fermentibacteria bacterium]|nr:MAG: hypothetical protein CSA37_03770 [Candidatus Fermentibacteria bacterium]